MSSYRNTLAAAILSFGLIVTGLAVAAGSAAATVRESVGVPETTALAATGGSPVGLLIFFALTALVLGALAVVVCGRRAVARA